MKGFTLKKRSSTPLLTLLALGVVFGDIGTSPIYAFQQSVSDGVPSVKGIYGTVSLIFWALMIVVSIKYLVFVLRADNKGEGGVLALFSLLPREIRRPDTKRRYLVYFFLMLGTAFLFGDGLITPSISVLSAVEGAGQINASWVRFEVPITVVILAILFLVQSKGTQLIGRLFGPITLLWFLTIGGLGIREITKHVSVLKALSPAYAISYVQSEGWHTFIILSAVILAITGVEALYADMGHFGPRPIRIGWFFIVAPCLIANYLGQAAEEITNPKASSALFFSMAPNRGVLIYLVIISTLATIIASQALISGVGSISRQAVQLGLFPRLKVVHTNADHEGQIYVPVMNTMLAVGSIFLVIVFGSSAKLANAYSFAIAGTMVITTLAFYIVAVRRWHWNKFATGILATLFGIVDLGFFASTSTKIFKGAWVPLFVALIIVYAIQSWRKGQLALQSYLAKDQTTWADVEALVNKGKVVGIPTVGVFMTSKVDQVPQALMAQINNLHVIPNRIVLVSVEIDDVPYASANGSVHTLNSRVTQVTCSVGYMDQISIPKALTESVLTEKEEASATYYLVDRKIIGEESGELTGFNHKVFAFLHRNASTAAHYFGLPESRVVSLAVQMDL